MKRILVLSVFALLLAGGAAAAHAKQYRFVGMHPIPASAGGGFCHIEYPHVHVFAPAKGKPMYRVHDGYYHFVGDPVAHGYDGPRHAYYGPHPLQVTIVAGDPIEDYCYIEGPHYHYEEPLADEPFTVKGGVYFYTGDYSPEYTAERPEYGQINAVYRPMKYARPVYDEAPPPEYHGPIFQVTVGAPVVVAEPVYVEPSPVVVERPVVRAGIGVEVHVPLPSLRVEVGAPVLVIGAPVVHHHDVIIVDHREGHGKWKHGGWGRGRGRGRGHWR